MIAVIDTENDVSLPFPVASVRANARPIVPVKLSSNSKLKRSFSDPDS
jgi:hypothetical protein